MRNTADVTGGKPIAVFLQSISGISAINPSVAFYDIHGGKREVLFFYFVPAPHETEILIKKIHTYHHHYQPINVPTAGVTLLKQRSDILSSNNPQLQRSPS
jgi:hypothetical protein